MILFLLSCYGSAPDCWDFGYDDCILDSWNPCTDTTYDTDAYVDGWLAAGCS